MPIYEFECDRCGKRFEDLLSSPDQRTECPHCSSRRVRRLFSCFAVGGARGDSDASGSACTGCTAKTCSGCR